MDSLTREQIAAILAHKYRMAYDGYEQLEITGKELLHEGDYEAHKIISQRARLQSQYFYGIKAAAEALGIEEDTFMEAVNQDYTAQTAESRKEGD